MKSNHWEEQENKLCARVAELQTEELATLVRVLIRSSRTTLAQAPAFYDMHEKVAWLRGWMDLALHQRREAERMVGDG